MRRSGGYRAILMLALLIGIGSLWMSGCETTCTFECGMPGRPEVLKYPLVEGASGAATILDPTLAGDPASRTMVSLLYDGLVTLDQRLQDENWAAQKVDVSPDGLTYTFHLHAGLAFASGTPVTSADYAYSINRALDPCLASPLASDLFAIKDAATFAGELCAHGQIAVNTKGGQTGPLITTLLGSALQTPDDHTLVVELAQPAGYFLSALTSPAAVALDPTLVGPDLASEQWLTQLVTSGGTSGMFTVTRLDLGGGPLVVRPNPHWWGLSQGRRTYLTEIDFTFFKSAETAYLAYQAGQFHVDTPPLAHLATVQAQPDFHELGALDYHGLSVNWTKPPLNNLDARQAVCLAIDRDALNRAALGGTVLPGWHLIPTGMPGFNPTATGPDGVAGAQGDAATAARHWAAYRASLGDSATSQISYAYNRDDPYAKAIANALRAQWQQALGIQAILKGESHAAWQNDLDAGNYLIAPISIAAAYPDPQQFLSQPFLNVSDAQLPDVPQADVLMRQADATTNQTQRLEDYQRAEQLLVHKVATCPLYQSQLFYQVRQCVHGFLLDSMGLMPLDAWAGTYLDNSCPNV